MSFSSCATYTKKHPGMLLYAGGTRKLECVEALPAITRSYSYTRSELRGKSRRLFNPVAIAAYYLACPQGSPYRAFSEEGF